MTRALSCTLWQAIVAVLVGVGFTFAIEHADPIATTVMLLLLLTLVGFVLAGLVVGLVRDWRAPRRGPLRRRQGGGGWPGGSWLGGVREPAAAPLAFPSTAWRGRRT